MKIIKLHARRHLKNNTTCLWSGINGLPVNTFEVQGNTIKIFFFISIGYQRLEIATPKYHFTAIGLGAIFSTYYGYILLKTNQNFIKKNMQKIINT